MKEYCLASTEKRSIIAFGPMDERRHIIQCDSGILELGFVRLGNRKSSQ